MPFALADKSAQAVPFAALSWCRCAMSLCSVIDPLEGNLADLVD